MKFLSEMKKASLNDHPNVVKLYGVCNDSGCLLMIGEYVAHGDLKKTIKRYRPLTAKQVIRSAASIAQGMHHIHSHGIIHRDLKPENVLVDNFEKGRLKITDFGLSGLQRNPGATVSSRHAGTPLFAAPELGDAHHSVKVDVFSFAVMLWVLMVGKSPWKDVNSCSELVVRVWRGERPPLTGLERFSPLLLALVELCWAPYPELRPTFAFCCVILEFLRRRKKKAEDGTSVAVYLYAMCGMLTALAYLYTDGDDNIRRDKKKAEQLLAYIPQICPEGAKRHEIERVAQLFFRAGVLKSLEAQTELALEFYEGSVSVPRDALSSPLLLAVAARAGHSTAKTHLAAMYQAGQGVTQDLALAVELYRSAAEQDNMDAAFNLAELLDRGDQSVQDKEGAAELYDRVARSGHSSGPAAAYRLGRLYEAGDGVRKDPGQAVLLYSRAAEEGDRDAQRHLAQMLLRGKYVERSPREAASLFVCAASQGDAIAQFQLGKLYAEGCGVEKDRNKARTLFRKSASLGVEEAAEALADVGPTSDEDR
eukprot:TRINITY_DN67_c4_g1_i1.p1 TRINITY_DN67_c4_g1~~TRINITY_DN67_c4_g1_i1.p1  ORF type:complete len:536 (-),score=133.04 TRINITY_DN67_c4_g1_i1:116-1723(-)